jgi:hypothetical protein
MVSRLLRIRYANTLRYPAEQQLSAVLNRLWWHGGTSQDFRVMDHPSVLANWQLCKRSYSSCRHFFRSKPEPQSVSLIEHPERKTNHLVYKAPRSPRIHFMNLRVPMDLQIRLRYKQFSPNGVPRDYPPLRAASNIIGYLRPLVTEQKPEGALLKEKNKRSTSHSLWDFSYSSKGPVG